MKRVDNVGIQLLRVNEDIEKESEKLNHECYEIKI